MVAPPEERRPLPLWLVVVLGVAGTFVAVWGLHAYRALITPVALAFVLVIVVHPLIGILVRRGLRRGAAVAVAVVLIDGGLIAFGVLLAVSIGQLATVLPQYEDRWHEVLDGLRGTLSSVGIGPDQIEQVLRSIQPSTVIGAVGSLFSSVASSVGALILVLATVLFMTAEAGGVADRLAAIAGADHLHAAMSGFARNTRRYIVVTTVFGLAVAVVDTVGLLILGIPLALLWGLVSFLTNYVPNIGFFLGLAPPTLLALLVGGPGTAVAVIVLYSLANFVLQSVIQPVFVGDAVRLSVTLSFLAVILWTVVLGPLGAVLAIPLTLLVHAVLVAQDPDRRWAAVLLAGASGGDPSLGRRRRRRATAVPAPGPSEST